MKRFLVILLCVAAFSAVSCDSLYVNRSRKIGVRVTADQTKGTVVTTSSLTKAGAFNMCAYVAEDYFIAEGEPDGPAGIYFGALDATAANVVQNTGAWVIDGNPDWIADTPMRFWSWFPSNPKGTRSIAGPASYAGEALSFSYSLPECDGETDADHAAGEDILFAFTKALYNEDNTTINVTFHHALSQVRFCISTDDGTFDAHSLGIKNISISNLCTSGSCVFSDDGNAANNAYAYYPTGESYDKFEWSGQDDPSTIGQDYDVENFLDPALTGWASGSYTKEGHNYKLLTNTDVFFVIPQQLSGNTGAADDNKITVNFIFGERTIEKTVTLDADEWLADHYYTYKIKATTVGRDIDMSVNLVGWSDRDDKLFI